MVWLEAKRIITHYNMPSSYIIKILKDFSNQNIQFKLEIRDNSLIVASKSMKFQLYALIFG